MNKNILSLRINDNIISVSSRGRLKKTYEVRHNDVVVASQESWRFPWSYSLEVIEANESVLYEILIILGKRSQDVNYTVRRNDVILLKIG